jgi:formylglycine-generating enzyme required for sulfatase activity
MLFSETELDEIKAQWEQLSASKSEGNKQWRTKWDDPEADFKKKYEIAIGIESIEAWRDVTTAGAELRKAMRNSSNDAHYLPRYYTRLVEFTDTIEEALKVAQSIAINYVPQEERDALIVRIERLETLVEQERNLSARPQKDLQARLDDAQDELTRSKGRLFQVGSIININIGPFSAIGLIRDALEALKHGLDLLNDKRFTEALRRQALAAWLGGRRLARAVRERVAALKSPWKTDAVFDEFEKREPYFNLPEALEAGAVSFLVRDGVADREEQRVPGAQKTFQDCWERRGKRFLGPEMVVVPTGRFMMGALRGDEAGRSSDEGPVHEVHILRPFAVSKYPITFEEWDSAVTAGGCNGHKPDDEGWGRGRRPVINVNWEDAKAYVAWLSQKTGKDYRLLSEAEWEYVARAGTTTPFWLGESISTDKANYDGSLASGEGRKDIYRQKTVPVYEFEPNPWGLQQVHGNVWEWVEDPWRKNYEGAPSDGSVWQGGDTSFRVCRGGSWNLSLPQNLRSACRYRFHPHFRNWALGFRVARTLLIL